MIALIADLFSMSNIVDPIVDYIKEKYASYPSLIHGEYDTMKGVNEDVEKLSSNLTAIQAVLEDAQHRQLDADHNRSLRDWLAKLREVSSDAHDILETYSTETNVWNKKRKVSKIPNPLGLISKASSDYSVANKIKDISAKIDLIAQEKNNFHLHGEGGSGSTGKSQNFPVLTAYFVDTSDVFGRDSDKDRLINLLLSKEFDSESDTSVVPIVGIEGLGKTTLAQLIFGDERVKNHFEFRMWVCVTVEFNVRRILKEMIEYHTEMKYSNNYNDLPIPTNTLVSRFLELMAGKDFLLVLDDVWTENYQEWEQLQRLLKQGGKGSRVLVTTRNTEVCDIVGTKSPYELKRLPEDDCWSLFKKIAFKDCNSVDDSLRKELEEIGRKIVNKCQGLPSAVKAKGGLLRGNVNVDKWNQLLRDTSI